MSDIYYITPPPENTTTELQIKPNFIDTIYITKNKFYKVSYDQFLKDCKKYLRSKFHMLDNNEFEDMVKDAYDHIELPRRSTRGSAGYDFTLPFKKIDFYNNQPIVIPTGIKMELIKGLFLGLFPRSSLGYKYGMRLENTIGIIDSDYYNNIDNEGHISAKISFNSDDLKVISLKQGDKYMQGIILGYGLTSDDDPISDNRFGGIGSTGV